MANASPKDIEAYGQYLISQGNKPEDVSAYTKYLAEQHAPAQPMSATDAALVKGGQGLTFGLRPLAAGAGSAIGEAYNQLTQEPVERARGSEAPSFLSEVTSAFKEGRHNAIEEQKKADTDHPYIAGAAQLAGNLVSAPLMAAPKTIGAALGLGTKLGLADAAGSAESLGEAATKTLAGTAGGGLAYGAVKGIPAVAEKILDSNAAHSVISKVEHIFGQKDNPITNSVIKGLEDYKSQFQFPKDSVVEKQLNQLIERVRGTPPSQWAPRDLEGITARLGPNAIQESLQSGAERLSDIGSLISSKAGSALSGFVEKNGEGLKNLGTIAGGVMGFNHGVENMLLGGAAGRALSSPETLNLVTNAIKGSASLANKLTNAFGVNPLTQDGLARILQTPEAKDILLQGLLEEQAKPPAKMSTTIKSKTALNK